MSTQQAANHLEGLKRRILNKSAVIICGAGTTIQATENSTLLWGNLIQSGREYVVDHGLAPYDGWADFVDTALERGSAAGDMPTMLTAADLVAGVLREADGAWQQWVKEVFGSLNASRPQIYHAISGLRLPILTTNYDTLIESALRYQTVDRTQTSLIQALGSGENTALVGHLHGVWNQSQSMVFSKDDYTRVAEDVGSGTIHRAVLATKCAIFVGFGSGMKDPNFEAVNRHLLERLGPTQQTHYRLCRNGEYEDLLKSHPDGSLAPIPFGDSFDDLPDFLESLAPNKIDKKSLGATIAVSCQLARADLMTRVRNESLLTTILEGETDDPLMEPVILPVPQEAFDRSNHKGDNLERIDPSAVATASSGILLVSGEHSGLSSALKWLLLCRSTKVQEAPILINFGALSLNRKKPVSEAVAREASTIGAIASPSESLPPLMVAIDDFFVQPKSSSRIEGDLRSLNDNWFAIGCRPGDESEASELLTSAGISFETRYLGRLNSGDVGLYAKRVDSSQSKALSKQVITTLQSERLPATPQTVLMLMGILITDQSASQGPTQSLVDRFVTHLMTLTNRQPRRNSLEVEEVADILEYFAHDLAEKRVAETSLSDFMLLLERYQTEVGWNFDLPAGLDLIVSTRILRIREDHIRFTLTSYLYLFAARYARNHPEFRDSLVVEPFFFSDVLVHYSALARNDEIVLRSAIRLIKTVAATAPLGHAFSPATGIEEVEIPEDATIDLQTDEGGDRGTAEALGNQQPSQPDALEHVDRQPEPFSLTRNLRPDTFFGGLAACEFAAAILRNSDQIKNLNLKREGLSETLDALGRAIDVSETDGDYAKICVEVVAGLRGELDEGDKRVDQLADFLQTDFPAFLATGVMGTRLKGSKIGKVLDLVVESAVEEDSVRTATLGLLTSILLTSPGLRKNLGLISRKYSKITYIRNVVTPFAIQLLGSTRDTLLKEALEDFMVETIMAHYKFKGVNQRQRFKGELLQTIRARAKQVPSPLEATAAEIEKAERVIDGVVSPRALLTEDTDTAALLEVEGVDPGLVDD